MAIKIKVPNANFNGERGGVQFKNGVGIFEDEELGKRIAYDKGYEIIELDKEKETKAETKKTTKKTTKKKAETKSE